MLQDLTLQANYAVRIAGRYHEVEILSISTGPRGGVRWIGMDYGSGKRLSGSKNQILKRLP